MAEFDGEENDRWSKCLFQKFSLECQSIFDDQFTLLYESDTLQLMHFTNGNMLHCVYCHHCNTV